MLGSKISVTLFGGVIVSVCSLAFSQPSLFAAPKYVSNSGCKCHLSKGCFEGDIYKETLHSNTWEKRLEGTPDAENPECLKCHATAYGEKIEEVGKKFLPNVQCEACHGPGSEQVKVKENYQGKGKDAFKELLKSDPLMARKVQYDAGLVVAGINGPETVKEQCLVCHWESEDAKDKCPKTDKVFDYKEAFKKDDHRDEDDIDKVIKKMTPAEKKKWAAILPRDPILDSRMKKKEKSRR